MQPGRGAGPVRRRQVGVPVEVALGEQQHRVSVGQRSEVGDHEPDRRPRLERHQVSGPEPLPLGGDQRRAARRRSRPGRPRPAPGRRAHRRAASASGGSTGTAVTSASRREGEHLADHPDADLGPRLGHAGGRDPSRHLDQLVRPGDPGADGRVVPEERTSSTSAARLPASSLAVTATCSGRTASSTRPSRVPRTGTSPRALVAMPFLAVAGTSAESRRRPPRRGWPGRGRPRWGCHLQEPAVGHHRDLVGQRQRFALVVGDQHSRGLAGAQRPCHRAAGLLAQPGVQRRERLVEQHHVRGRGASARASATRCCCPPDSSCGCRSARHAGSSTRSSISSTRAPAAAPRPREPEGDVRGHVEVGEQRSLLRDVADPPAAAAAPGRPSPATTRSPSRMVAGVRLEEARDQPQQRGLAAAGRRHHPAR